MAGSRATTKYYNHYHQCINHEMKWNKTGNKSQQTTKTATTTTILTIKHTAQHNIEKGYNMQQQQHHQQHEQELWQLKQQQQLEYVVLVLRQQQEQQQEQQFCIYLLLLLLFPIVNTNTHWNIRVFSALFSREVLGLNCSCSHGVMESNSCWST